jgi:dipeptidyl aminopeptidase/acylaminoacyl peptidase
MEVSTHKLSNGIVLTLRQIKNANNTPLIVLCHGFCGVRELLLPAFAEAFVDAGFSTITFDYHGFGDSDDERGRLVPKTQIADILSVVNWAKMLKSIDKNRIGLWGTSLGGCHVFGAAAQDPSIRCIVSQLAFADGEEIVMGKMTKEERVNFLMILNRMSDKQNKTGKEMFVEITKVLSDSESRLFFENNKVNHPKMDIKIPFLTVREILEYKPFLDAANVNCPVLIIIADNDTVNPPEQGYALFDAVRINNKQLYVEENAHHYDMYTGKHFDNILKIQTSWFRTNL